MVLVATAVGFGLSLPAGSGLAAVALLAHTLLGTLFVGGGANALNQYIEAPLDLQMKRTLDRPVPSGRLSGQQALWFGVAASVVGLLYLALQTTLLASLLAAISLAVYVFVYTPLKRTTPLCVFVGAIPGALPPVIGWAAGAGALSFGSWALFSIVFLWQLPHFAAIAWRYRVDYATAGYAVAPIAGQAVVRAGLHTITPAVALIVASLLPAVYGLAGLTYAVGALVLGLAFLMSTMLFVTRKSAPAAGILMGTSLIYLPSLLAVMMIDRLLAV